MEARRRPIPPPIVTSSSGRPKSVPGPLPSQPGCGPTSPATPSPTSPKSFPSVSSGIRAITATWSPSLRRKSTRFPKTNLHSGYQAAVQRSASHLSDASDSNRHSLATISDFLGRGSGDRGYTLPAFRSSQTGDPSVRNELLDSVQTAIVQLFQKKRLATELHILQESVRRLTKSESGPLIYDYFKDKLLRKGMVILRESMKNQMGAVLLEKLGQQWTHFYTVILPLLQAILYPLPMADLPIRETCLVEFRDTVVLKINLMETLEFPDVEVSPFIEQMLLVLQSVQDSHPPNKNYLRLEKLVARVVVPYLGHAGLYDGHVEPEAASQCDAGDKDTDSPMEQNKPDESSGTKSASLASLALPRHVLQKHSHLRQNSAHNIAATLAPVAEHDSIRRHSIALEQVS